MGVKLTGFRVSRVPDTEHVADFSHGHVFSTALHYPTSISQLTQFALRRFFSDKGDVPFRDLYVTNIGSRYHNDAPFCSELNEENASESYLSLSVDCETWSC